MLDEPVHQLVRQQLLAHELEHDHVLGAARVRVVHVCPEGDEAYAESLLPAHRVLGDTVHEVWRHLLRAKDRFVALDSALFLDEHITSREYVLRYAPDAVRGVADLLRLTGAQDLKTVEDDLFVKAAVDSTSSSCPRGSSCTPTASGTRSSSRSVAGAVERAVEAQEELEAAG